MTKPPKNTSSARLPRSDARRGSAYGFEDLQVFQAAQGFRRRVYKLADLLPDTEKFALAQQMRRAAVSLTNNIAEGYGRHHWQANVQFCRQAAGSLMELIDDINICIDQGYADLTALKALKEDDGRSVLKLLNGYIAYLRRQKMRESKQNDLH